MNRIPLFCDLLFFNKMLHIVAKGNKKCNSGFLKKEKTHPAPQNDTHAKTTQMIDID